MGVARDVIPLFPPESSVTRRVRTVRWLDFFSPNVFRAGAQPASMDRAAAHALAARRPLDRLKDRLRLSGSVIIPIGPVAIPVCFRISSAMELDTPAQRESHARYESAAGNVDQIHTAVFRIRLSSMVLRQVQTPFFQSSPRL